MRPQLAIYEHPAFGKCKNCQEWFFWAHRTRLGVFCSRQCADLYGKPGSFCDTCLATTNPESAGNTVMVNGMSGTRLRWTSDPCPRCGSVVQHKFRTLIFPLFPLGIFRVKYVSHRRYFSRKLNRDTFGRHRLIRLYCRHYGAMAACGALLGLLIMVSRLGWPPGFSVGIIVVMVALMIFLVR